MPDLVDGEPTCRPDSCKCFCHVTGEPQGNCCGRQERNKLVSEWICIFCLVEDREHKFEIEVLKGAECPKCPVHTDDYLCPPIVPCCTTEGRELLRDDLGQYDNTGDAFGPSWICTGCKKRTTW